MRPRSVVALLAVVLAFYLGLVAQHGWVLLTSGTAVGIGLGIGVLILPVIGVIVLVMELRFGRASARLDRRLVDEVDRLDPAAGSRPVWAGPADLPRRPSGRVDRGAADAWFATVRAQVEADPDDWRDWFALGRAYDLAGDRRRARAAIRRAIDLAGEAAGSPA